MKKTESARDAEFEAVLDRELGRVLDGRASVDECCAANPGYAEDLRPLLQLAFSGRSALKVDDSPSAATVASRKKLMAQARSLNNTRKSGSRFRLRPLAMASGLFLLLFASTALAAGSAEPDSVLYPLKQHMESARTTLAMDKLDQARAETEHANNRLDELKKMMEKGKGEYCGSLLADYEARINNASAHAAAAAAEGEDTSEVDAFISSVRERHDSMLKSLGLEERGDEAVQDQGGQEPGDAAGDDDTDGVYPGGSSGAPSNDNWDDDASSDGSGGRETPGGGRHEQPGDDDEENDSGGGSNNQNSSGDKDYVSPDEESPNSTSPKKEHAVESSEHGEMTAAGFSRSG
ncbi:MAG: DUF5667 domain-containing protein [Thermoleophilia bacterium]